jgi:hypothetical protein
MGKTPAFGRKDGKMNPALWLPLLFVLGLATFALLFAFLIGCDRV